MRTVYLGTSPLAVTVLERLAEGPHRPELVVTRPDRPRGRGRRLAAPPVADAARELGLEVFQPESVNSPDARDRIAEVRPEAVCLCAFGALIKEPLLSDYEILNVHPSLLPRWRGAAPIERAIEAGDEVTGVTIIRLVEDLDAGPACLEREEPIRPDDDFGSLSDRLARLGGDLLVQALDEQPPFHDQPGDGATYAEMISPADRLLDPARTADELERRVRALSPHVGAHVELPGGDWLGVRRARHAPDLLAEQGRLEASEGRLLLGTADGALELIEVQPAGKRSMEAAAYLRGQGARLAGA